jgi:mono/diheme cytochrome c family protein
MRVRPSFLKRGSDPHSQALIPLQLPGREARISILFRHSISPMSFQRDYFRFPIALAAALVLPAVAVAQDSAAAAIAERPLTSGVFSQKQVERGEGVYRTSCQSCHAKTEYTGDKFKVAWVSKTAFDIFDTIRTQMPEDNPGSLERQEYVDVVVYIFSLNAYPAGANDLAADDDGLKKVRIDNPPPSTASRPAPRGTAHPRVTFRK